MSAGINGAEQKNQNSIYIKEKGSHTPVKWNLTQKRSQFLQTIYVKEKDMRGLRIKKQKKITCKCSSNFRQSEKLGQKVIR